MLGIALGLLASGMAIIVWGVLAVAARQSRSEVRSEKHVTDTAREPRHLMAKEG